MSYLTFIIVFSLTAFLIVEYKAITMKKAFMRHKSIKKDITKLDLDEDFKKLLFFLNDESTKPLLYLKSLLFMLNFKQFKKSAKAVNDMHNNRKNIYFSYTVEATKTYFTYAPHWIPFFAVVLVFVAFYFTIFSQIDKIKDIVKPLEYKLINH